MCAVLLQRGGGPAGGQDADHLPAHPVRAAHHPCTDRLTLPQRSVLQRVSGWKPQTENGMDPESAGQLSDCWVTTSVDMQTSDSCSCCLWHLYCNIGRQWWQTACVLSPQHTMLQLIKEALGQNGVTPRDDSPVTEVLNQVCPSSWRGACKTAVQLLFAQAGLVSRKAADQGGYYKTVFLKEMDTQSATPLY